MLRAGTSRVVVTRGAGQVGIINSGDAGGRSLGCQNKRFGHTCVYGRRTAMVRYHDKLKGQEQQLTRLCRCNSTGPDDLLNPDDAGYTVLHETCKRGETSELPASRR
jgi:hypothetical protein